MEGYKFKKKGSESGEQIALFAWCAQELAMLALQVQQSPKWDGQDRSKLAPLRWYHSIPNGGSRGDTAASRAIAGGTMKAEGVKSGVSDTCLPFPSRGYSGLYIELKRTDGGTVSKEQKEFGEFISRNGFFFAVCYGEEQAKACLKWYLTITD